MSLVWGDFVLNNFKVSNGPNILRQFKNIIPFGIQITQTGGTDPILQQAWSGGYNQFYFLDAADVAVIESTYYGS